MSNPFLQRPFPSVSPWDQEKARSWGEIVANGRWRYALHWMAMRFKGGHLIHLGVLVVGSPLFIAVATALDSGAPLNLKSLGLFFTVAWWLIPLLVAATASTGFIEGWMRWGLYERISEIHAGPLYHPTALASHGVGLVGLLNARIDGSARGLVVRFDGRAWHTIYRNDGDALLIDVASLPDGGALVTRAGGDVLTLDPDGSARVLATGQEGAYIAPVSDSAYLLAGSPLSLWYQRESGALREVGAQTGAPPVVCNGRIYLIDFSTSCVAIVEPGSIKNIRFAKGAWLTVLAVAPDGTLYAGENTGPDKLRGRVIWLAGERWEPLRAPFTAPVKAIEWDGGALLVLTIKGLYRYDPGTNAWARERDTSEGWLLVRLRGGLALVDGMTGAVFARDGAGWREEPFRVPLGPEVG